MGNFEVRKNELCDKRNIQTGRTAKIILVLLTALAAINTAVWLDQGALLGEIVVKHNLLARQVHLAQQDSVSKPPKK